MDTISSNRYKIILTIGILFAFFYYPVLGHFMFYGRSHTVPVVFYSRLFIWLEVVLLFFYARSVEKKRFLLWEEKPYGFWFYPASFGALYLLAIGAGILSKIPILFGLYDNRQLIKEISAIVNKSMPLMIFTSITAGATEELIFRAYLVPRLELIFKNKFAAVIVSALMFSFAHYHYFSISEMIFAFFIAIVFAIHYHWYRNIRILIFTHAVIDFVSFTIYGIIQSYHLHH
ncbi:MAG: CPBP family intramembrane glutamic endopeptidase [Sphingobacteriales bacterium]